MSEHFYFIDVYGDYNYAGQFADKASVRSYLHTEKVHAVEIILESDLIKIRDMLNRVLPADPYKELSLCCRQPLAVFRTLNYKQCSACKRKFSWFRREGQPPLVQHQR